MFIEEIVDVSKLNKLPPKKGYVVLSEPFMMDNNFKQAVVYLCEHNKEGSYGFILNNLLSASISELIQEIDVKNIPVAYGGPVQSDSLFYLHNLGDKIENSTMIVPGIWSGGNFDQVISLINDRIITKEQIRFFLGYSGWTDGQLVNEMKSYSWIVVKFNSKNVLKINKDLWRSILKQKGGQYKIISNFPLNPLEN